VLALPKRERAAGVPDVHDVPPGAVQLARICRFEAELRAVDCAAIYHVGLKRAASTGRTPVAELLRYSTLMRTNTPRARRIRAEQPPAKLVQLAGELLRGEHSDPCMRATGWGSAQDGAPTARSVRVTCMLPTANLFWRH
jgi:hypothetical protein